MLRRALWSRGFRYRLNVGHLVGKPDIVLPRHRLAVFVDGDFWHGNQWCKRGLRSLEDQFGEGASNRGYWLSKIRGNMDRDCATTRELLRSGWQVLRFWESDVRSRLEECVEMTVSAVRGGQARKSLALLADKSVAEFFAGIGLMRMGLERKGWRVAYANDIDESKQEMYASQFPDWREHFVLGDVHKQAPESVPPVTLATASFPCNDLSLAGSRDGLKGKHSGAFWGFHEVLRGMAGRRPPLVLLENVPGFLTSHRGQDFVAVCQALNALGYVVDTFVLDAARFVPQSRQRLFIAGVQRSLFPQGATEPAEQVFYQSDVRPKALAEFILAHPEINWRIRDLPGQPVRKLALDSVLEDLPEDSPEWWDRERAEYLLNQMSEKHRSVADGMVRGPQWSSGTVFRRVRHGKTMAELRTDGVAGCLRTPRGGSGRQILFQAGGGEFRVRLLTPRECARLMGAGDFRIDVPRNQALFGFGDAVCVPAIEWIAENYLNPLVNELLRGRALRCSA